MKKRLLTLILICALPVVATAQRPSNSNLSPSPSTVARSATESPAQDDEIIKSCRICAVRLAAAEETERTLRSILADKDKQIAGLYDLDAIKDKTIAALKAADANSQRIDANNQKIDANSIEQKAILQTQNLNLARELKETQDDLRGCESSRKYIALGSAAVGAFFGYKFKGSPAQQLIPFFPQQNLAQLPSQPMLPAGELTLRRFPFLTGK